VISGSRMSSAVRPDSSTTRRYSFLSFGLWMTATMVVSRPAGWMKALRTLVPEGARATNEGRSLLAPPKGKVCGCMFPRTPTPLINP
jgi:hypothetical protein